MRDWLNGPLGAQEGPHSTGRQAGRHERRGRGARKGNSYLVIPGPAQDRRSHDPVFLTTCMTEIDSRQLPSAAPGLAGVSTMSLCGGAHRRGVTRLLSNGTLSIFVQV